MQLPLPLQEPGKTVDQQLIELAEAADVNFLVDATNFAAAPPPKSIAPDPRSAPRPFFGSLLASLVKERDLSYLRYSPSTFLFWPRPEPVALARQVAADKNSSVDVVRDRTQLNALTAETGTLLADYLQTRPNAGAPLEIDREELPEALRQHITTLSLTDLLANPSANGIWFSDEFWRTVRLHIAPSNVTVNGQTTTHNLEVVGTDGQNNLSHWLDSR